MISARALLHELAARGVAELIGVPCSYLTPLINRAASDAVVGYVPATQEGEALAIAAGAWLAGVTACVVTQNSGLGNMVNPLTSLTHPCRIPVPIIVTWRGEPGHPDEPQHEQLGVVMRDLLSLIDIRHSVLPAEQARLGTMVEAGWAAMRDSGQPYAFLLRRDTVEPERLWEPEPPAPVVPEVVRRGVPGPGRPCRIDVLDCLLGIIPDTTAVISTTGKTSRELFTLRDRDQHFYLVGAMGSASAVGLGVARHTSARVVVLDGDGAALMRLGTLATVGAHPAPGLVHVLLDNQVHDSTGGQRSLSAQIDFPALASACGYRSVYDCWGVDGFAEALESAQSRPGPSFVYLRTRPGSLRELGRPTLHPSMVARRFRDFLTGLPK